jgi:hypothetical protein
MVVTQPKKEKAIVILWIICLVFEGVLSLPILGGVIVLSLLWIPLIYMFLLHTAALIVGYRSKEKMYPSIIGLCAAVLGWIPILGWMLHVCTVVALSMVLWSYHQKSKLASMPYASSIYDTSIQTFDYGNRDSFLHDETASNQMPPRWDAPNEVEKNSTDRGDV